MDQKEPDLTHYRRIIETHRKNRDPLIMVRVDDLAKLLDRYAEDKPRIRRAATGVQA